MLFSTRDDIYREWVYFKPPRLLSRYASDDSDGIEAARPYSTVRQMKQFTGCGGFEFQAPASEVRAVQVECVCVV